MEEIATAKNRVDEAEKAETRAMGNVVSVERSAVISKENLNAMREAYDLSKRVEGMALAELARVVRVYLANFQGRRKSTVQTFETSLIFIGEAINPEAPNAAKAPTLTPNGNNGGG